MSDAIILSNEELKDDPGHKRLFFVKTAAYIIAGGEGSRLGRPKWDVELGGKRVIDRIAEALSSVPSLTGLTLVVRHPISEARYRVICDSPPENSPAEAGGPLVGLFTALQDAGAGWIIVSACDLPFVSPVLFEALLAESRDGLDAIVPVQPDATPQPLCAVYRVAACLSAAEDAIRQGGLSMFGLLERVRTQFVPFERFAEFPNSGRWFFNVNTPDDLETAVSMVEAVE